MEFYADIWQYMLSTFLLMEHKQTEILGFRTGTVWVSNSDTVPVPAETVPAMGTGIHRTRLTRF